MLHPCPKSDERKRLFGRQRMVGDIRDKRDVFVGREAWHQIVELKHEPHMLSAVGREPLIIERCQFHVFEIDMAACRVVETTHDVEQRRLAAARRAEQHDHLSGPDFEVDAAQCVNLHLSRRVNLRKFVGAENFLFHVGSIALLRRGQ